MSPNSSYRYWLQFKSRYREFGWIEVTEVAYQETTSQLRVRKDAVSWSTATIMGMRTDGLEQPSGIILSRLSD